MDKDQNKPDPTEEEDQAQIEGEGGEAEEGPEPAGDDEPTGAPTEDELEALTEEERAALEEDDEAEDDGDAEGEEDDAQGAADPAPADPAPAAQKPDPAPDPAKAPAPALPEATAQRLNATFEAERKKILDQYDDGELTRAQMDEAMSTLQGQYAEATAQAVLAAQTAAQERAQWNAARDAYKAQVPGLWSEEHVQAWNKAVLEVTGDDANWQKGLTMTQMLEKAHRRYLADQPEVKAPIPALPRAKTAQREAPTPAKKPEPPVTLARIPAAMPSAVSDGRYGQLQAAVNDAETAEEVERIMAGMTEAEREAFASMDV